MARRPDRPCCVCGELQWTGRGSLPEGQLTCHKCRRKQPYPPRDLELIQARAIAEGGVNHLGLGWLHQQAVQALRQLHKDGSPCDWCGRPMWLDPTKNWDYDPKSSRRNGNGTLQADHFVSRKVFIEADLPIPLPDRLLHGTCNMQRGDGRNDHLAWIKRAI